jgi:rhomboid family GlyGly-CTERM serine protease
VVVAEELKLPASSTPIPSAVARWPWATGVVTILALAAAAWPQVDDALVYDRLLVMDGEWWRGFTGHWVHFSPSHLFWNLVVLVPAGVWVERLAPVRTRVLFLLAPAVIGATLFAADASLMRYAGLSGVAAAVLALLALTELSAGRTDRWFWRGVLALIAVKIGVELLLGRPGFARFSDPSIRPVPLAHLAGVICAGAVHFTRQPLRRWRATG